MQLTSLFSSLHQSSEALSCLQGASTFLQSLASSFGAALFTQLPVVRQLMLQPLLAPQPDIPNAKQATDTLQILKIAGPVVHEQLFPEVLQALPAVVHGCGHAQHQVQHMSVMCAVELAATHTELVLPVLLRYPPFMCFWVLVLCVLSLAGLLWQLSHTVTAGCPIWAIVVSSFPGVCCTLDGTYTSFN